MINNFDFNHRIILQKEEQISGECGEVDSNFENIAEVWANIEPISLRQNFSQMKRDTEVSHIITICYREDAKNCKKIIFKNRCFEVLGFICPKENYNFLTFNVKEII